MLHQFPPTAIFRKVEPAHMSQDFPFEHFLKKTQNNTLNSNIINDLSKKENTLEHASFADKKPTVAMGSSKSDVLQNTFNLEELEIINQEILNNLKEQIPPQKFSTFFESTFATVDVLDKKALFSVTTPFIKTMVDGHYLPQIQEAISSVLGKEYQIEIKVIESKSSLSSNKKSILNTINSEASYQETTQEIKKTSVG